MPTVGRFLGPVLGPRKKMPKPIPASANPEVILGRLRSTVKVRVKDQPIIQSIVGSEDMTEAQIAENVDAILDVLDRNLEKGQKQIKALYIKTTMGPVTRVI
jgi:large subunit ribosomal protein L1